MALSLFLYLSVLSIYLTCFTRFAYIPPFFKKRPYSFNRYHLFELYPNTMLYMLHKYHQFNQLSLSVVWLYNYLCLAIYMYMFLCFMYVCLLVHTLSINLYLSFLCIQSIHPSFFLTIYVCIICRTLRASSCWPCPATSASWSTPSRPTTASTPTVCCLAFLSFPLYLF